MTIARGGIIDSAVATGKLKEELKKYKNTLNKNKLLTAIKTIN